MIDKDFIFSKMESLYVSIFAILILNVIFFIIISIITFYHYIWVCYLSMVIIVIIVMIIINIVVINIIVVIIITIIIVIIIIFLWGRINFYIIRTVWFTPTYQIWSDRKVMFTVSMFVFVCLFICCLFNVLVQQPPFWY